MAKLWHDHMILLICLMISGLLLIVFLLLQWMESPILVLEGKWLILAGVPVLVGLIAGGYIKKFKGFGVELETVLERPVTDLSLVATDAMFTLSGDMKEGIERLRYLTREQIEGTKRLGFISGRPHYYIPEAVHEYFNALSYLEYIEIKKEPGEFISLIPMGVFREQPTGDRLNEKKFNPREIAHLVYALETNTVLKEYEAVSIDTTVQKNTDLLMALKTLHGSRKKMAAVIDENHRFIGLLPETEIEHRIAEAILAVKK